ncbi:hypothetical protein SETIT_9G378500v2 [Setaria italica]|uniref:Uncharacterized protein n=1 Tax=Setaria italica TaxID=4555 RepID=K4AC95_SETIT|nr:uncharacterized protein LOC101772022 [Setaria italica]RCV44498.1 hypothetical protein SETIT_9G378500v2 [Setaria italica]
MGQGKEVKTRPDPKVEIQEKGEIFFFYRPKVGKDEARGPDDVQRMYIVLRPESGDRAVEEKQAPDSGKEGRKHHHQDDGDRGGSGGGASTKEGHEGGHGKEEVNIEEQPLLRLVVMGRKSLPDPAKHSRPYWGYVELVTTKVQDIKDALKEEEYSTATQGQRRRPAARALGEGVYRILRHEPGGRRSPHTHLVYKLELPTRGDGEPQEAMNVEPEASFLVQVKNPDPPSGGRGGGFRGLQSKRRAAFPAHLQGAFGSRRFAPADPPDLLNYEGCELLLIAASDDVEEELGLELEGEAEGEEGEGSQGEEQRAAGCSDLVKMFGEVADVKPLLSGSWD